MASKLLLQDGYYLILEDGSGDLLLEQFVFTADTITSVTTVTEPSVSNPTILSVSAVTVVTSVVTAPRVVSAIVVDISAIAAEVSTEVLSPDVLTGDIRYPEVVGAVSLVLEPVVRSTPISVSVSDAVLSTCTVVEPIVDNTTRRAAGTASVITTVLPPTVVIPTITRSTDSITVLASALDPTVSLSAVTLPVDAVTVVTTVETPAVLANLLLSMPVVGSSTVVVPPVVQIGDIVHVINSRSRQQIVVDQQQGGTVYPFASPPSDDLDRLIGDLYLNFKDSNCEFTPPFRIKSLTGFGTDTTDPLPEFTSHFYDVVIVDANDDVVFDSRLADGFKRSDWTNDEGVYLRILEWHNARGEILRVVTYIGWPSLDDAIDWPIYFEPENAVITARAVEKIVPTVESLTIAQSLYDPESDLVVPKQKAVVLREGYNTKLVRDTTEEALVAELGIADDYKVVQLSLAPGFGLGRVPCEPEIYVSRISGVEPTERGNITIDATGCYRVDRPITAVGDNTANVTKATLRISNDCGPCCSCEDFINVYEAIRRLTERYKLLGARATAIRDQLRANRDRWMSNFSCRTENNIQATVETFAGCKAAFAVGICNNTDSPLLNIRLKVSFVYGPDDNGVSANTLVTGCVICNSTTRKGNTVFGTNATRRTTAYELSGDWPDYEIEFDCINPGSIGTVTWVMQFSGCSESAAVEFVTLGGKRLVKTQATLKLAGNDDCCVASDESEESSL